MSPVHCLLIFCNPIFSDMFESRSDLTFQVTEGSIWGVTAAPVRNTLGYYAALILLLPWDYRINFGK